MEDPKLIATLIPSDTSSHTANAFCHKHNRDRYLAPEDIDGPALSSREPTPAPSELIDEHCKYDFTHRLALKFGKKVKNPAKGFCFGANTKICDVLSGTRRHGISNVHLYMTFGAFDGKKRLIPKDVSTHGTAVAYSGQARDEVHDHFVWILDLDKEEGKWEVEVCTKR
ncbi:hypothetical protein LTR66_002297 [Elasticomyces elasticus]|nr:hypothetical protein LTR28_003822 [Elasticomyces elasticus]KAK4998479.1 hypothetical protein LTR66_002297 [Elasticomyces elasticus]